MLLRAPSIRNVIISNNNPDLKMEDWLRIESPRISVVNQDRARACPKSSICVHVRARSAIFELANALGYGPAHEAWERPNWDDMVISHSGVSRPCICDVGAVTECPTGAEPGIAVWREDGFFAGRLSLFQQLCAL
jgi:hypothetical protein